MEIVKLSKIRHQKSSPVCGRNLELYEENIVKGFAANIFVLDSRKCGTSSLRKHAETVVTKQFYRTVFFIFNTVKYVWCAGRV